MNICSSSSTDFLDLAFPIYFPCDTEADRRKGG